VNRPNIVFILTDQMRGDCLGALGHPAVKTPHLDGLARGGTLFTAAYSACPSCIAARASLFTGQRPTTHGRLGYRDGVPWRYQNTLAEVLARSGYQTHCVGKTHFFPQRLPLGFETQDSYEALQNFGGYVNDYFEWLKERTDVQERDHGLGCNSWVGGVSRLPEELHNNSWVVTRGIDFLRRRDPGRPFFLNLSFHRPHAPLDPPAEYLAMYQGSMIPAVPAGDWAARHDVPVADENAWRGRLPPGVLAQSRRAYYAQITHIDAQIGRFIRACGEEVQGPTWFIFTSDHGEMLGDHNLFRKTYAYEGSARVPLIVAPPGGSQCHVSDAPVTQSDIMPTILQAAGVEIPASVEGRSAVPLLAVSRAEAGWRDFVHGEHSACYHEDLAMQFLTDGREKYIWHTRTGEEQYFDLRSDPDELHDLAETSAGRERLLLWRSRLVKELAPRTEDGLSDGRQLFPGKNLPAVRSSLLA
jgi:arylsulfatase